MLNWSDRKIIEEIGKYKFLKMKELNMTLEEFQKYEEEKKKENRFKREIGYKKYYELKAFNMTVEQMKEYLTQKKRDEELIKQVRA